MKILLSEFITGGGLLGQSYSPGLAREGSLMLQAMLRDFRQLSAPNIELHLMLDPRFLPLLEVDEVENEYAVVSLQTHITQVNYLDELSDLAKNMDWVFPVAPESERILESLSDRLRSETHAHVLLSSSETIHLCADKFACLSYLQQAQIPCVPSYLFEHFSHMNRDEQNTRWVVKPRCAEGAEGVSVYQNAIDVPAFFEDLSETERPQWILQPFVDGESISLSLLCKRGKAILLACNTQEVSFTEQGAQLRSLCVNGQGDKIASLGSLALQIAQALPGLYGYIGVDLMMQAGQAKVLEINPRLTTSYAGLATSLGQNPAEIMLNWLRDTNSVSDHSTNNNKPITIKLAEP